MKLSTIVVAAGLAAASAGAMAAVGRLDLSPGSTGPSFTKVLDDPYETWAIGTGFSTSSYTLTLPGIHSAASLASYDATGAFTVVMPEPDTATLLLAGLAVAGFVGHRRSA